MMNEPTGQEHKVKFRPKNDPKSEVDVSAEEPNPCSPLLEAQLDEVKGQAEKFGSIARSDLEDENGTTSKRRASYIKNCNNSSGYTSVSTGSKSILLKRNSSASLNGPKTEARLLNPGSFEYSYESSEAVARMTPNPGRTHIGHCLPCKNCQKCCCLTLIFTAVLIICASAFLIMYYQHEVTSFYNGLTNSANPEHKMDPKIRPYVDQRGSLFIWQSDRLPTAVSPKEIGISLTTDIGRDWRGSFSGSSEMKYEVLERTDVVIFHFHYPWLEVNYFQCERSQNITVIDMTYCLHQLDMYALKLSDFLEIGDECQFKVDFNASIQNAYGLFYDEYSPQTSKQSEISYSLVTNLQDKYARFVFPCLDEPTFKARFSLVATFNASVFDLVLFNSPQTSETNLGGLKTVFFEKTVPMPTYVVAIAFVKNFDVQEKTVPPNEYRDYPVLHRMFYPKELAPYVQAPLELATESMEVFEGLFNIGYPMKKCDHFPVRSLNVLGMENWGLITYSLMDLLYKSEDFGIKHELSASSLVVHEMAHQWFGNLVTMNWWDNIWLNEGFATFMSNTGLQLIKPELKAQERFYTGKLWVALDMDAFSSTHPIHQPDLGSFDLITYYKSCGVLSMLEFSMGRDNFFAGVSRYLEKFKYSNADVDDLWAMLSLGSNHSIGNISALMDTWINQKHVPIVNVTFDEENIYLKQSAYCYMCTQQQRSKNRWSIPLTYTFPDDNVGVFHTFTLDSETAVIPLNRATQPSWIKFNTNSTGLYRMFYSKPNILKEFETTISQEAINSQSNSSLDNYSLSLPYMDRGNLVIDALAAAKVNLLTYREALEFASSALMKEQNQGAIELMLDDKFGLSHVFERLTRNGYQFLVNKFVIKHLKRLYPGFDMASWTPTTEQPVDFKARILELLCLEGYQPCLDEALDLFQKWEEADGNLKIHPYIKDVLFPTVSRYGSLAQWEYMLNRTRYNKEDLMLYKLWSTKDSTLIRRILDEHFFNSPNIKEETSRLLTSLYYSSKCNQPGSMVVWELIKTHWKDLYESYGYMDLFGELLTAVFSNFDSPSNLHELLYAASTLGHLNDSFYYAQGLESVAYNIKWKDYYLYECVQVFEELTK